MAHYTIKPGAKESKSRSDADPRERLAAELDNHLSQTFRITLEKRCGTKWEPVEACGEIDVLQPDESEATTTAEERKEELAKRRDELVDVLITAAVAEAGVDGPSRFRAQGWPERGRRELWTCLWLEGPPSLAGELAIEKAEAGVATINVLCAVIDRLGRNLDRSFARSQSVQDHATANVNTLLTSLANVIKAKEEAATPMVELERIKIQEREKAFEATLAFETEKNSMAMFMEAVGLIGKAVMAERRDKKREEREKRADEKRGAAANEEPIDVDAKHERAHAEPPPRAEPREESSESTAIVVHGERFDDAEDLASLLEDLEPSERHALQRTLGSRMWGLVLSASEARDASSYDQRFNDFYDAYIERSPEEAARLFTEITGIIGAGAAVLAGLIQSFERRTKVRVG